MKQIATSLTELQLSKLADISEILTQSRNSIIRDAVNNYIYRFYYKQDRSKIIENKVTQDDLKISKCEKLRKGECQIFLMKLDG